MAVCLVHTLTDTPEDMGKCRLVSGWGAADGVVCVYTTYLTTWMHCATHMHVHTLAASTDQVDRMTAETEEEQSCLLVDHDSCRFPISVQVDINWLNLYLTITFIITKQHAFDL